MELGLWGGQWGWFARVIGFLKKGFWGLLGFQVLLGRPMGLFE